jgi:hypothetical protein
MAEAATLMALGMPAGLASLLESSSLPTPYDFEAQGNGIADDTQALMDWAAACKEIGTGMFTPGTFITSQQLVIDGFSVYGPGSSAVIKPSALGSGIAAVRIQNTVGAGSGLNVSGFAINGPGTRSLGVKTANVDGIEFYGSGIQPKVSNVMVQNCDRGSHLNMTDGNLVFAGGNHFTNNFYNLYQTQSGSNITFSGRNFVEGATFAAIATQYNVGLFEWVLDGALSLGFSPYGIYQEGSGIAQQTISSGTYNNGTGLVTLTMSAPLPGAIIAGTAIGISSLTGTGGFAGLAGGFTVASVLGSTLTYQASSGLGASAITGGKLDVAGTEGFMTQCYCGPGVIFEAIGNGAILSDLTGNGGINDGGFGYNEFWNCGFSWNGSYKIPSRDANYAVTVPFWRGWNLFSDNVSPFAKGASGTFNVKNGYTGTDGSIATLIGPRSTSAPWQDDGTLFNNNTRFRIRQTYEDPFFISNNGNQGLNIGNPFAGDRIQILGGAASSNQVVITPDPTSADTSVSIVLNALDGNVFLTNTGGNSGLQFQLATGAVELSITGSDTNSAFAIQPRGNSSFQINEQTSNNSWFAAYGDSTSVNSIRVVASHTGNAPQVQAVGSDTNVDINLTPKGTGVVILGAYTSSAPSATGYISVKDSTGTVRKLLCA